MTVNKTTVQFITIQMCYYYYVIMMRDQRAHIDETKSLKPNMQPNNNNRKNLSDLPRSEL